MRLVSAFWYIYEYVLTTTIHLCALYSMYLTSFKPFNFYHFQQATYCTSANI
jgi:hypothetical protein